MPLKLKTCQLYYEKLILQKVNDMYTQVLTYFLSASYIMEAARGHFHLYGMKVAGFKSHIVVKYALDNEHNAID